MADNSTVLKRQEGADRITITSAKAVAADDILLLDLGGSFQHVHVQIRQFDVADVEIVGGAGTCTLTSMGPGGDNSKTLAYEPFDSAIDLTAPVGKTAVRPVEALRGVLAAETLTITWQLIVTFYKS